MNVNQKIDLNLSASGLPPTLKMAQYDANSRTIVATLWDGASRFVIPSNASVMVRFGKPDGTGGLYDETEAGEAVTFDGNVVTAPVASQMLSVAGKVQADIEIYQTGETEQAAVKLATFCFVVNVERAAYQHADMISSDYYNIIAGQIQKAILAGEKVDTAIAARDQAVAAATSAERSRDDANQYAKKATIAADSAEDAQNGAVAAKTAAEDAQNGAVAAKTAAEDAQNGAVAAKTAAEAAQNAAEAAQQSAEESTSNAAQNAEDAEAWAVGKRNGVDVSTDDPAYHNNARYYKDQAQGIAGGGVTSFNGRAGSVEPQSGDYTKDMVGLGNVDNTADANKPVSTAQQEALGAKQDKIMANGFLRGDGAGNVTADKPVYIVPITISDNVATITSDDTHMSICEKLEAGYEVILRETKTSVAARVATQYICRSYSLPASDDITSPYVVWFFNVTNKVTSLYGNSVRQSSDSKQKTFTVSTQEFINPSMTLETLTAAGWDAETKTQTIAITGLLAASNGTLAIAQSATDEQWYAWAAAAVRATGQTNGSLTLQALGDVPTVDIPVEVIIL